MSLKRRLSTSNTDTGLGFGTDAIRIEGKVWLIYRLKVMVSLIYLVSFYMLIDVYVALVIYSIPASTILVPATQSL